MAHTAAAPGSPNTSHTLRDDRLRPGRGGRGCPAPRGGTPGRPTPLIKHTGVQPRTHSWTHSSKTERTHTSTQLTINRCPRLQSPPRAHRALVRAQRTPGTYPTHTQDTPSSHLGHTHTTLETRSSHLGHPQLTLGTHWAHTWDTHSSQPGCAQLTPKHAVHTRDTHSLDPADAKRVPQAAEPAVGTPGSPESPAHAWDKQLTLGTCTDHA